KKQAKEISERSESVMNETELEQRRAITANERLIISLNDEGNFRVYSPLSPSKSYTVSGTPEGPKCTCSDFEEHKNDPDWKCNHMLAVLNLLNKSNEPPTYEQEPQAVKEETMAEIVKGLEMHIKRSVSLDGRIDSL